MSNQADFTCNSPDAEKLCAILRVHGVVRIPNYLTPAQTEGLLEETRLATSECANYRNPFGECSRFSLNSLPAHLSRSRDLTTGSHLARLPERFARSRDVLDNNLFRQLTRNYLGPDCGFMEVVVFTRDWIPDRTAVYGKLHFDRCHQLKCIFYLNDVDETNGAFGCIPRSHTLGRELFVKGWTQVLSLVDLSSTEVERQAASVQEDRPEYRLVPCVQDDRNPIGPFVPERDKLTVSGPAGTLIVFDSNILHHGGMVSEEQERWTLKGHTFAIANMETK